VASAPSRAYPLQDVVARNLRKFRGEGDLSQEQLADAMRGLGFDWTRVTVSQSENTEGGRTRRLSIEELVGLAEILNVPVVVLISGGDEATTVARHLHLDRAALEVLLAGQSEKTAAAVRAVLQHLQRRLTRELEVAQVNLWAERRATDAVMDELLSGEFVVTETGDVLLEGDFVAVADAETEQGDFAAVEAAEKEDDDG
jgi:transcriptional regulator with XRE-family HTH domain